MNLKVNYEVKRNKRSKHIRISIYPTGKIIVSAPKLIPKFLIDSFINSKKDWIIEKQQTLAKKLLNSPKLTEQDFIKNKQRALNLVNEKLIKFNQFYQFEYKKVSIKDQKTRWGSCSSKKNLNFNYKILFLQEALQDYIIVHELCHLKEMNHSQRFWNLVEKVLPNYKFLRKQLHKEGLILG